MDALGKARLRSCYDARGRVNNTMEYTIRYLRVMKIKVKSSKHNTEYS